MVKGNPSAVKVLLWSFPPPTGISNLFGPIYCGRPDDDGWHMTVTSFLSSSSFWNQWMAMEYTAPLTLDAPNWLLTLRGATRGAVEV